MKIGTATSVLYQYELKDAVPLIARAGFDGVDIWGGRPHIYRQDYSTAELEALRKQIADHGLVVSSFMPAFYRYPHSLSNPNPKVRQDSLSYMRDSIDNAAVLGAKIVLIVPDLSLYGQSKSDSLQRLVEGIDAISRHASQYELTLGIEVLYDDETDLVNSSGDALEIIRQLGHRNLGVVADTGTLNLSKEDPRDMLDKLQDLLLQIHVNDNHGGEKQENLIPGEGSYDFLGLIRVLKECGYSGFLSAELSKEYSKDPEPALRLTAQRLRRWMQA
jgi:fructoselysine 3-epimerase